MDNLSGSVCHHYALPAPEYYNSENQVNIPLSAKSPSKLDFTETFNRESEFFALCNAVTGVLKDCSVGVKVISDFMKLYILMREENHKL